MDPRIKTCPGLTESDVDQLQRVEAGLAITADVSRADLLLCCMLSPRRALVAQHTMPESISSLYRQDATGRLFAFEEQPLLARALKRGQGGRRQIEIVSSGAPVLQDVYPIYNQDKRVIAALIVETNMIADERQRRRNRSFRQAVFWLQEMCLRGELESARDLSRFGLYDGIYLVDRNQYVIYMSGIAVNMFRSISLAVELQRQRVAELEPLDRQMVDEVFQTGLCIEQRLESSGGRVWVRKALPLRISISPFSALRFYFPWFTIFTPRDRPAIDAVLLLLHNATETEQKQRELNVKAAIIQEVHHRVKNNLQTIAGILRMQARRAENETARQDLTAAVNRVLSMSVIHEFLSQDEHRPINIRDVCQRIAHQVRQVAGDPSQEIEIQIKGPTIRLPAGQATPVAMVINELMLNAIEHGLSGYPRGYITITLRDLGDSVEVTIQNSGRELPPNFDPQQSRNLGLQIVHTLVTDDLKGELSIESVNMERVTATAPEAGDNGLYRSGVRAVVTFPKRSLKMG